MSLGEVQLCQPYFRALPCDFPQQVSSCLKSSNKSKELETQVCISKQHTYFYEVKNDSNELPFSTEKPENIQTTLIRQIKHTLHGEWKYGIHS